MNESMTEVGIEVLGQLKTQTYKWMDGMGWDGWDGRLSPSASLLRAPYGANNISFPFFLSILIIVLNKLIWPTIPRLAAYFVTNHYNIKVPYHHIIFFKSVALFFKHIHAYFVSDHHHILYKIIIISRNLSSNEPLTRPLSLGMQHPFVLIQNYISLRCLTCIFSLINLIFQQVLWIIGLGMQILFVLIQN